MSLWCRLARRCLVWLFLLEPSRGVEGGDHGSGLDAAGTLIIPGRGSAPDGWVAWGHSTVSAGKQPAMLPPSGHPQPLGWTRSAGSALHPPRQQSWFTPGPRRRIRHTPWVGRDAAHLCAGKHLAIAYPPGLRWEERMAWHTLTLTPLSPLIWILTVPPHSRAPVAWHYPRPRA